MAQRVKTPNEEVTCCPEFGNEPPNVSAHRTQCDFSTHSVAHSKESQDVNQLSYKQHSSSSTSWGRANENSTAVPAHAQRRLERIVQTLLSSDGHEILVTANMRRIAISLPLTRQEPHPGWRTQ